ncbi:MAG: hypothetical protein E3J64_07120 [Anaerolineales bacterium]|nr:MAG: hypothetical protein E3J64_07120 [Anaerolineales bacterium]
MNAGRRLPLVGGLLLIVVGGVLLAGQFVPDWEIEFSWPWIVIAVGAGLLFLGLLTGQASMAIPACIVAGIGGILLHQDLTGDWDSWGYMWALIPGFAGVGTILAGVLSGGAVKALREGGKTVLVSLVLFAIFAGFFGALGDIGEYWPVLIIVAGLWAIIRALLPQRGQSASEEV